MKSQKGSITLYVLMSVLFFTFVLVGIYVSFTNRASMEKEQLKQIKSDYNKYDTDEKLNDLYNKLSSEEEAGVEEDAVYNQSGNKIITYALDKNGDRIPVPNGFYFVGGTVNTGVVISDNQLDENLYKNSTDVGKDLVGNQFVWIPVNGTTIKYEQDFKYSDNHQANYNQYKTESVVRDTNGTITYYEGTWKDEGGNKESVKKYGGFYIGRYEAGFPTAVSAGDSYLRATAASRKNPSTNTQIMSPVSKAGIMPWNYISLANAKRASTQMYNFVNSSVTSSLIDSYAWDTTVNWLVENCSKVTATNANTMNSTSYGNYGNNKTSTINNTLYAYQVYRNKLGTAGTAGWEDIKYRYASSNVTTGMTSNEKNTTKLDDYLGTNNYDTQIYRYDIHLEAAAGASEDFKTNNIYDLAGNVAEITTESRIRQSATNSSSVTNYHVVRGGTYRYNGSSYTIAHRYQQTSSTNPMFGFRVVLYIK